MSVLDTLLSMEIPQPEYRTLKQKRLSARAGTDVVFKIKELSFSEVEKIVRRGPNHIDTAIDTVLAGVVEPNFRDQVLCDKYNAPTPAELVKAMLRPGEIETLATQIETLSGYNQTTLEEVEKN